ncbi:Glutathione S-transferase theta-1 [Trichoplax sp. H2]|nr:Glutathione S-transferase theta-1 [Trichoplax sp. H2]|eukprot:RDD38045.1 Glutathione S-transferase theta-1 [Trichoplax sp. H2]
MSKIDFYSYLVSPPCRAVHMFLTVNNIPFNYQNTNITIGEQRKEEFLKVNPHGKVPVIKDGDFCLTESVAIIQYLAEKYSTPDHWYPRDPVRRARVDEFLSWHQTNTRLNAGGLFFNVIVVAKIRNQPRNEEAIKERKEKLKANLEIIENHFLKGRNFLGGDEISIADIVGIVEIAQNEYIGVDAGKDRPNIKAWRERVVAKLGSSFTTAHELLAQTAAKYNVVEPF